MTSWPISRRAILNFGAASLFRTERSNQRVLDPSAFGAKGDSITDDAAALNRAAEALFVTGGALRLAPGRYRVESPILLGSETTLFGTAATIFSDDRWHSLEGGNPSRQILVRNRNFASKGIRDHDIKIQDLNFEFLGRSRGDSHAVSFRMARDVTVSDCHFNNGGDATAFLSCLGTRVLRCFSNGTVNCAYDHWEGTSDAIVKDCEAVCRSGYGILFTGQGTSLSDDRSAEGCVALGNRIASPGSAGIWVCSLSAGSSVSRVAILDNIVQVQNGPASGIGASGAVSEVLIRDNIISGAHKGSPLFTHSDHWNRPSHIYIRRNKVVDCSSPNDAIALIEAQGDNVEVSDNYIIAGFCRSLVWVDGTDIKLFDNHEVSARTGPKYSKDRAQRVTVLH